MRETDACKRYGYFSEEKEGVDSMFDLTGRNETEDKTISDRDVEIETLERIMRDIHVVAECKGEVAHKLAATVEELQATMVDMQAKLEINAKLVETPASSVSIPKDKIMQAEMRRVEQAFQASTMDRPFSQESMAMRSRDAEIADLKACFARLKNKLLEAMAREVELKRLLAEK